MFKIDTMGNYFEIFLYTLITLLFGNIFVNETSGLIWIFSGIFNANGQHLQTSIY